MSDNDPVIFEILVAEAHELKKYRKDGILYSRKCAELIERIKSVFDRIKIDALTENQLNSMKLLQKLLLSEEQFATSSFESRSPDTWKEFLDD